MLKHLVLCIHDLSQNIEIYKIYIEGRKSKFNDYNFII